MKCDQQSNSLLPSAATSHLRCDSIAGFLERLPLVLIVVLNLSAFSSRLNASDWPQRLGNALHSGDASGDELGTDFQILAALPLSDSVMASPVINDQYLIAVDASGVVHAFDVATLNKLWSYATDSNPGNCNNVASPVLIHGFVHVGTMSGRYVVLEQATGKLVNEMDCGEPILSSPVVSGDRVYFTTLGATTRAVTARGDVIWGWDFVKEVIGFEGDRWSGSDWLAFRGDRVTWKDHFVCSRDLCMVNQTLVVPCGGRTVFLQDLGDSGVLLDIGTIPSYAGTEYPATFGQSGDAKGNVYVQWHRRDNAGRVEVFKLGDFLRDTEIGSVESLEPQQSSQEADTGSHSPKVINTYVPKTETSIDQYGLLGFSSPSVQEDRLYRVKPESGAGLVEHHLLTGETRILHPDAGLASPVLTRQRAIYGGLDGKVYFVPLHPDGPELEVIKTPLHGAISTPVSVAEGRIYVANEDGYIYVIASKSDAVKAGFVGTQKPTKNLHLHQIRNPLRGPKSGSEYNWYTNYGDFSGTNANDQGLVAPLRMRWAMRLDGTIKHLPVCGGGRLYLHTAEGQILAVEQDTGRLLWRRYWPDVYLSFTSPLYVDGKLIVPQAGIKRSVMRCLDAETGELLWEAPFTGSPSWSRQFPPVVSGDLAIYASGAGDYAAQGTEKPFVFRGQPIEQKGREVMSWIYSNDNPYYPKNHKPRLWAWDCRTGELVWEKDFSEQGRGGNDCGICLLDGKLYYSVFFGYDEAARLRRGLPPENNGLTMCLDPKNGNEVWSTNEYYVTSKCTLSAREGKLYIGGFNRARSGTDDRFVWCLDAETGKLVWQSDPVTSALNVVTVGPKHIFSNALRGKGNVFDRSSGKVVEQIGHNYACCRFTLSEPYVLGANMDMIDLSDQGKLVSTGPAIDSRECLGAVVSNGRIFYASQASGFVVSQTFGQEAEALPPIWEQRASPPK
ncbi:MAG: PQQ-binding-like beta-propeller repeat protein [Planctomycetota bacterium]|nr:PQQ-binding-like beta-propeller repeat protein [Planctomycetota bacterium]